MIVASEIELRAGARLLLEGASFQVSAGDRIGLVGRNGAGKTTLAKVLAGQAQPAAGSTGSALISAPPKRRWPTPTPPRRPTPSAGTAGSKRGSRSSAGTQPSRR